MLTRFEYRVMLVVLICLLMLSVGRAEQINDAAAETVGTTAMPVKSESGTVDGFFPLMVGDQSIDATYLPETLGRAHGNVLILPGADEGIDSKGVVHGLRHALPTAGWAVMTLALNYPQADGIVLAPEMDATQSAESETATTAAQPGSETETQQSAPTAVVDNTSRILTALADLRTRSDGPIILLGHGQGVNEAVVVITEAAADVAGLIMVAADPAPESLSACPENLAILDLIAGGETRDMQSAKMRKVAMLAEPERRFTQRIVAGSDAAFHGFEQPLFSYVRGWLHKHFVPEAND